MRKLPLVVTLLGVIAAAASAQDPAKPVGRVPAGEKETAAASASEAGPDSWFGMIDLGGGLGFSAGDSLHWRSPDGKVKVRVGGRLQWDYGWVQADQIRKDRQLDLEDQGEIRRFWPYLYADYDGKVDFMVRYDLAPSRPTLETLFLRLKGLPVVGNFAAGYFLQPFSLEELTANKYVTFIERSVANSLSVRYGWGMQINNTAFDDRMTWAAGVFRSYVGNDFGNWGSRSHGDATAMTGRTTVLPIYEDDGRELLHLGMAYSLRCPRDPISFSRKFEANMTKTITSTGPIDADREHRLGAELAWVHGPLSIQGEYHATGIDATRGQDDLWLHGFYVQASYFLTGEHRPYNRKNGTFAGVKPNKDFVTGGGWGAWQVAVRYSFLDLNDGDVANTAHRVQGFTAGVNWYLNQNMRISGNYVRNCVKGPLTSDAADIFLIRLQVAF